MIRKVQNNDNSRGNGWFILTMSRRESRKEGRVMAVVLWL